LEKTSRTNSALLFLATLVGFTKGKISNPPHPSLLPFGEKEIYSPLFCPLISILSPAGRGLG